jgi:hypothetical protein
MRLLRNLESLEARKTPQANHQNVKILEAWPGDTQDIQVQASKCSSTASGYRFAKSILERLVKNQKIARKRDIPAILS